MVEWFLEAAMLAAESQRVIALRLFKLAFADTDAPEEAHLMVREKVAAGARATRAAASGASAVSIVKDYRRIVRANIRRLDPA